MARLITKAELQEKIAEMQKVLDLMTHKDLRVCEKCFALYHKTDRSNHCYCDYESDRYGS